MNTTKSWFLALVLGAALASVTGCTADEEPLSPRTGAVTSAVAAEPPDTLTAEPPDTLTAEPPDTLTAEPPDTLTAEPPDTRGRQGRPGR